MDSYYRATTNGVRDPGVWDRYWTFPARWYNAKPQNVSDLLQILPAPSSSLSNKCQIDAARVVSIKTKGNQLNVLTEIPWSVAEAGTSGEISTRYKVLRVRGPLLFSLVGVEDDPVGQHACVT